MKLYTSTPSLILDNKIELKRVAVFVLIVTHSILSICESTFKLRIGLFRWYMIISLVDSHYNCVKDKGYLASLWQPAISCSAWLCGLLIRVIMHLRAMITPVLITSENIIMAMVSHIKITSPLWYNSDLTRSLHLHTVSQLHPGATVWKKLREASFLFWR